jgi:DNA-binding protein HU-beta
VTKDELAKTIASKTGQNKSDVLTTLEAFFKVVKSTLANNEEIFVRGFGSFILKKRARKQARIISRNEPITINEHYIPAFKPSKLFVNKIKESQAIQERLRQEQQEKEKQGQNS